MFFVALCMLKLLIILALITYVLSKVGGFFFRVGAASQNRNQHHRRPDSTGNAGGSVKKERRGNIKGGDYVDYEEVK